MVLMKHDDGRGFIFSLEPAISLLFALLLITLVISLEGPVRPHFTDSIAVMHETDLWLVQDSISYYGGNVENEKFEWVKGELE
mgnify:CR=1 FL=1